MAIDVLRFADLNCRYAAIQVWSANQESEMAIPRLAYKVWLCGECDSHTEDKDNGDHLCETCGQRYDHAGHPLPDDDADPELLPEYRGECLSPDVQEWLSRRL